LKASILEDLPHYKSPLESLPSPHKLVKNIYCSLPIQVFSWSFAIAKEVVQSSWPPKRLKLQKHHCRYYKLTFPCFIKFLRNDLFSYTLLGSEKKEITCNKEKALQCFIEWRMTLFASFCQNCPWIPTCPISHQFNVEIFDYGWIHHVPK